MAADLIVAQHDAKGFPYLIVVCGAANGRLEPPYLFVINKAVRGIPGIRVPKFAVGSHAAVILHRRELMRCERPSARRGTFGFGLRACRVQRGVKASDDGVRRADGFSVGFSG